MKAENIMIGNIVNIDRGLGEVVRISTVQYRDWSDGDRYNITVNVDGTNYDREGVEVIPTEITPKILRAVGFEKEPSDFLGYDISDWYSLETDKYHLSLRGGVSNSKDRYWSAHIDNADFQSIGSYDLQYLHQLQNFMTLVGYELEINLEDMENASKED